MERRDSLRMGLWVFHWNPERDRCRKFRGVYELTDDGRDKRSITVSPPNGEEDEIWRVCLRASGIVRAPCAGTLKEVTLRVHRWMNNGMLTDIEVGQQLSDQK